MSKRALQLSGEIVSLVEEVRYWQLAEEKLRNRYACEEAVALIRQRGKVALASLLTRTLAVLKDTYKGQEFLEVLGECLKEA